MNFKIGLGNLLGHIRIPIRMRLMLKGLSVRPSIGYPLLRCECRITNNMMMLE